VSDPIEDDIQASFRSTPYPGDNDLLGWQNRSADWQAAWAGAYRRAAENSARVAKLEEQVAKLRKALEKVHVWDCMVVDGETDGGEGLAPDVAEAVHAALAPTNQK
jgi:hypothetical protein